MPQANFPAPDLNFTESEGDGIKSRLPFKTFSTLKIYQAELFCFQVKAKKLQREEERAYEVMSNNLILLRHLTEIASSKRVPDGNKPYEKFPHLYEQILLFRRSQLNKMATSDDGHTLGVKFEISIIFENITFSIFS